MGSGFSKLKKQAKLLQQQYTQMQDELKNLKVTGIAGAGLVEISMNGDHEVLSIKIKPDCVDKEDIEGLQDLILAAMHDAHEKVKQQSPQNSGTPFGF